MNEVRVEVHVSGAEGAWMARSLEAAGFVVSRPEHAGVASPRARVVVVEVPSASEVGRVLREWRSTADGAPPTVVLVGPEDADASGFGAADAFFRRPVPMPELVRAVRTFLSAERAARAQTPGFTGAPTVRLDERSRPPSGRPPPAAPRSRLSPKFEALLLAADRRLFPDETALPLDLPGGHARPEDLVPDELLASPVPFSRESPPLGVVPGSFDEPRAEEPGPAGAGGAADPACERLADGPAPAPEPEPLATTALVDRRDRGARGSAPPSGKSGAALLLSLSERASPHRVAWRDAEARRLSLVLAGGAVVRFEGPVDPDAARRLHAEGRIAALPPAGAEGDVLERAAAEGALRRVDLTRCRREATEAHLAAFALAGAEGAEVEEVESADFPAPLTRPVREIVLEACRGRSAAPLADGEAFHLRSGARAALACYGLLPEECAALEALVGVAAPEVWARADGVRGLEGLVALLLDLGLATAAPAEAPFAQAPSAAALRVYLARASARAVDGSYFDILGIPRDADGAAVERAHGRLVRELALLDLAALGLAGLARDRARVLESVDEAYVALRSDRLRRAYAAALAAPEGGR